MKKTILFVLMQLAYYVVVAQCTGDCKSGYGTMKYSDGSWYQGYWNNSLFQGKGKYTSPKNNITLRDGIFTNGVLTEGILKTIDGDIFEGIFSQSQDTFQGKFTKKNGDYRIGMIINGSLSNSCTLYFATESCTYIGECQDNLREGAGNMTCVKTGVQYNGGWHKDKFHGYGVYRTPIYSYVGDFLDGKKHGKGVYISKDKKINGDWAFDKPHGVDTFENYVDRSIYVGEFREGKRSGKGNVTYDDGRNYDGIWVDDKFHGEGIFTDEKGLIYRGNFKDNKLDGWIMIENPKTKEIKNRFFREGIEYPMPEFQKKNE